MYFLAFHKRCAWCAPRSDPPDPSRPWLGSSLSPCLAGGLHWGLSGWADCRHRYSRGQLEPQGDSNDLQAVTAAFKYLQTRGILIYIN